MKFFSCVPRRRRAAIYSVCLAALFSACATGVSAAAVADGTDAAPVMLNFTHTDIALVARALGTALGQTILVDPRVKGQITLVADQPVPQKQALQTLEAALRMQGYALLDDHGVLKVVPESDAKLQGVATYVGNAPAVKGEEVITQVFQLHHGSAQSLLPVLRPLISPDNQIAAYAANNTLVVTDYADNVSRIAAIVAGIEGTDDGVQRAVTVVPVRNANALDLAPMLQKLLDPSNIGATDATLKVEVIADPRTNSIGLRASDPSRIALARALIAQLDQPTSAPGNIHVVRLKNADALKLAHTLRALLGDSTGNSGDAASLGGRHGGTAFSGGSANGNGSANGSSSSSGDAGNASASSRGVMPPLPSGMGDAHGMGGGLLSGAGDATGDDDEQADAGSNVSTMVQADAGTNSLIIVASEPVYRNLRAVIDQLDVRRAQIYLEALILDVSADRAESLGVQWQGMLSSPGGGNGLFAGTNFNQTGSGENIADLSNRLRNPASPNGASSASVGASLANGLNIGWLHRYGSGQTLGALLQAIETNGDVDVLSTPNLITLDNEDAQILVGQNVGILEGETAPSAGVAQFNSYNRQNVGITLHVRPQITENGVIKMTIYQEDSAVDKSAPQDGSGPTIDTRSIQSTVLADNGQIIVLGGLIQDIYDTTQSKVPGLGDLPWIGGLFRYESKTRTKSNLMVFLRPVILPDSHATETLSLSRYDEMRALTQTEPSPNRTVRDLDPPQLPSPSPNVSSPEEPGRLPAASQLQHTVSPRLIEPDAQSGTTVGAADSPISSVGSTVGDTQNGN